MPPPPMRARTLPLLILLVLLGCGGPPVGPTTGQAAVAPRVDDETFHEVERAFWRMDPAEPARLAWRDALVEHLASRSQEVLRVGDYDEVVRHLASMTELLTPEDVASGRIPRPMEPLARWVIEHGSPRGDEGRVMGALVLLDAIAPDASHREEREQIAQWGREVRRRVDDPMERFGDLIQIWEQHEELSPSPDVLEALARLYVEQRDALLGAAGPEATGRLTFQQLRIAPLLMQRAPLDVAAVYLRHGDLAEAIEHVAHMGSTLGVEARLLRVLRAAQRDDREGADALNELARGFVRARPNVTAAICRLGLRRHPRDASFPLCLARVAVETEEYADATGWYAEAVRLAPDERDVYDEALAQLEEIMQEGIFGADLRTSRSIGRHALAILEERARRFPSEPPSVSRDAILLAIGRAEMSAGNPAEARARLEASLAARDTRDAHLSLGLLLERTGAFDEAATHYRAALDRTPQQELGDLAERAELLEHLGDAFRGAGQAQQATRMYRQAYEAWEELAPSADRSRRGMVLARQGILRSRMGDDAAAMASFRRALEAAPGWREPYAAMLSHLVVARPDPELAEAVLRRAQYQLTLEPEWRVYFALWTIAVAGRASAEAPAEVRQLLEEMAAGEGWPARLASFGAGRLDYAGLRAAAATRGEQAEALFYEGTRLLATGDRAGAVERFREVVATGMVNFFEHQMAQELLAHLTAADRVAETR